VFPTPSEQCTEAQICVWIETYDAVQARWGLDEEVAWEIADRMADLFQARTAFWVHALGSVERFTKHGLSHLFGDVRWRRGRRH